MKLLPYIFVAAALAGGCARTKSSWIEQYRPVANETVVDHFELAPGTERTVRIASDKPLMIGLRYELDNRLAGETKNALFLSLRDANGITARTGATSNGGAYFEASPKDGFITATVRNDGPRLKEIAIASYPMKPKLAEK